MIKKRVGMLWCMWCLWGVCSLWGGCSVAQAASGTLPEISAGARLAGGCANCHGTDGKTLGDALPPLAGQDKTVLLTNLTQFKSGQRSATVMQQIAKAYTDEQLALLADYFAAQK
jgi:cytochrome subunit of sulfide dehydrogenase